MLYTMNDKNLHSESSAKYRYGIYYLNQEKLERKANGNKKIQGFFQRMITTRFPKDPKYNTLSQTDH